MSVSPILAVACVLLAACHTGGPASEIRIPKGAGGVGFLPLLVMEKHQLLEKHAREAGIENLKVRWIDIGGPSVMNDALLSGSADFTAAGPPAFLTLWDKTGGQVMGVAAMASLPMYLNTREERLNKLEDLREGDKIAVTAIKVSIPSLIMQMYAREKYGAAQAARFDRYTVSMTHPDGVIALLGGSGAIQAHFTSPPFHQRERQDPRVHTILVSDQVMGGSTTFTMIATTARFHQQNPRISAAFVKALEEADSIIAADRKAAAELLLSSTAEKGFSVEETAALLASPEVRFTTAPENVMKYAGFMRGTGTLTREPASWKDLFFPEIHGGPGS
jgi:NitT/TauT family transport system substrate-binding protein